MIKLSVSKSYNETIKSKNLVTWANLSIIPARVDCSTRCHSNKCSVKLVITDGFLVSCRFLSS